MPAVEGVECAFVLTSIEIHDPYIQNYPSYTVSAVEECPCGVPLHMYMHFVVIRILAVYQYYIQFMLDKTIAN